MNLNNFFFVLENLWFPIQIVVAPLLIIGIILIAGIVLVVLGGGSLNLWGFGPFSIFSLRGRTESRNSNLPSTETRNVNLPSTERQAIQPIYNFNVLTLIINYFTNAI